MKKRTNPARHQAAVALQPRDLENVVNKLIERRLPAMVEQVVVEHSYSGPLPPAKETEHFERVHPGFTNRWITMSEKEQASRHQTSRRQDWMAFAYSMLSLFVVSMIVFTFLGTGAYLLTHDKTVEGFSSIGVGIAAVIGVIIFRPRSGKDD